MASAALLTAAVLTVIIGLVHSWLGEVRLIGPLLAPDTRNGLLAKSDFARSVLRFAWHLTTVAWIGIGAVFAIFARGGLGQNERGALLALALTMLATGLVILYTGRGRHWAWPVFLAIAACAAYAALT
jgi:hypothetical protein